MFNMNGNNTYNGLDMNIMKDFQKACATHGPACPFCREYLAEWSNDARWIPYDFPIVAKMTLSSAELLQWKMWLTDEAHENVRALEQWLGLLSQTHQVRYMLPTALPHVHDFVSAAWDKINMRVEYQGSCTKIQQGLTKPYSDFIGRLEESIEKQVRGDQTQKILLCQLAFDNTSKDCRNLFEPIQETGDIIDYLKSYRNEGTFKHNARVAALETMAIQKEKTSKCFNCGKPRLMKKVQVTSTK
jgi:hypothetical protein